MRTLPEVVQPERKSRVQLLVFGCLTAVAAAALAFVLFDLPAPPLDTATLLNPPPVRPTANRPTATVIPAIPRLFLADNFSTRKNWPVAGGDTQYGYVENGYMLAPPPNAMFTRVFLLNFKDSALHDLSVQVEAKPVAGSSVVDYGMFFWHSQDKEGQERFLFFGVNTDGMYTLRAFAPPEGTTPAPNGGRWVDLVPGTSSPSINKDGEPNRLRVDVHPNRVIAFVNGELVLDRINPEVDAIRTRDDFDGTVGLLAYSLGKPDSRVMFTAFELFVDTAK